MNIETTRGDEKACMFCEGFQQDSLKLRLARYATSACQLVGSQSNQPKTVLRLSSWSIKFWLQKRPCLFSIVFVRMNQEVHGMDPRLTYYH
jgi:hypothetical protein